MTKRPVNTRARWTLRVLAIVSVGAAIAVAAAVQASSPEASVRSKQVTRSLLSVVPAFTWSTTAAGGTSITISDHGNVLDFESPTGYEHMAVDGYVLCYTDPTTDLLSRAYDVGETEANFGPATSTGSPPGSVVITRTTTDGLFRLKQTFTPYISTSQRLLTVRMDITNLSTSNIQRVQIRRHADWDIDSGGISGWASDAANWHGTDGQWASFAWNEAANGARPDPDVANREAHFMAMRGINRTPTSANVVLVEDDTCAGDTGPAIDDEGRDAHQEGVFGDFAGSVHFNTGLLNAGASRTIIVEYDR